jgi:hypothetical protein
MSVAGEPINQALAGPGPISQLAFESDSVPGLASFLRHLALTGSSHRRSGVTFCRVASYLG